MKNKLSVPILEELKKKGYRSVIIVGASNPAEIKDSRNTHLLASKELVFNERVTQNSFHVSIDDPVLIEICNKMDVFIEA